MEFGEEDARGRHFFVVPCVIGPTTSLVVQFWGGPLDRSLDWWRAFTWSNENRGKAAASNPISCRKRKGRVSGVVGAVGLTYSCALVVRRRGRVGRSINAEALFCAKKGGRAVSSSLQDTLE